RVRRRAGGRSRLRREAPTRVARTVTTVLRPPDVEEAVARSDVLRPEVRAFLADELAQGRFTPRADAWLTGWDEQFSRRLGARGWIGMILPSRYGGHERSAIERFAVTEELVAAGSP